MSLNVQPIANLVKADGFQTTIGDLIRRAIVDSDSAASDILMRRLGGPHAVQAFLERAAIEGIRIDRDERQLQTETIGLTWRDEFVDPQKLERAAAAVTEADRDAAYRKYQSDPRDTATPEAMASLLHALAGGKLLSPTSTTFVLDVMRETKTFPDRLKAGIAQGWGLGHKTGSSRTWKGTTAATNDVGILRAPDGTYVSIVVFIADSKAAEKDRAKLMADIARCAVANFRGN